MKALNNLLSAAHRMLAFECAAIASKQGVDPRRFMEVVNLSSGRSNATEVTFPRHVFGERLEQGFSLGLMSKDVGLATSMIPPALRDLSLGELVEERMTEFVRMPGPEVDINTIITAYEHAVGSDIATSAREEA